MKDISDENSSRIELNLPPSQDVLFGALEDEGEDRVGLCRLPLARVQHHLVPDDGRRHGGEQEPSRRIQIQIILLKIKFIIILMKILVGIMLWYLSFQTNNLKLLAVKPVINPFMNLSMNYQCSLKCFTSSIHRPRERQKVAYSCPEPSLLSSSVVSAWYVASHFRAIDFTSCRIDVLLNTSVRII